MTNLTEQRIMVLCDFSESMNNAIAHGMQMATIFRKEMCLFHPLQKNGKAEKLAVQKALSKIIHQLKKDLPDIPISSLTLKGALPDCISRIAEQYDGIMLVLTSENVKAKLPALQVSQIPFLFVNGYQPESLRYKNVLLPVDFRKVMKDTSLWASYFARFNKADVTVFPAMEKNKDHAVMIRKNVKFIKHLLTNLKLDFQISNSGKGSFGLPFDALQRCQNEKHDLLIIPSSKNISLIDLIIGLPEAKIIKKANHLPVLCINPKRDMYILCD
nr:universal stress protein [Sunxiuqinia sp.]|tara:strand:+ start:182 stop:997 length:816 start_codon:yes stop_codon:yes gene_type:complete